MQIGKAKPLTMIWEDNEWRFRGIWRHYKKEKFCSKSQDKLYGRKHPNNTKKTPKQYEENGRLHAENSTCALQGAQKYTHAPTGAQMVNEDGENFNFTLICMLRER